ncbi:ABC transporter permease subunit [uncultured Varibaculum sp.]|uniref:amino acid ABC transporter permease n=1 Tax=uncultured Varibaculum sp. TaxID=413896 RepID=UPI0027D981EB|nr:ABC transporter permease subunit [uncultured Varibaculum sp.]
MNSQKLKDGATLTRPRPVFSPGRLVSAVVVLILAAMLVHGLVTNEKFRWDQVAIYIFHPTVLRGIMWTLILTVVSMLIGVILAVTMAIMRQSPNPIMKGVSWTYIWFFRGTPIYTQLLFWGMLPTLYSTLSLGVPFGPELLTFDTNTVISPAVAAILGLGLNEGAYLAEIVRSGLNAVDSGQEEAARALGMRRSQILRRIILPQAMRIIIPPTGNETISMLKTTSLVLAVPFTLEITFATQTIGQRLFLPIPLLLVAAIWYLTITSILMVIQNHIESYFGRGFDERTGGDKKSAGSRKMRAMAESGTTKDDPFLEYTP